MKQLCGSCRGIPYRHTRLVVYHVTPTKILVKSTQKLEARDVAEKSLDTIRTCSVIDPRKLSITWPYSWIVTCKAATGWSWMKTRPHAAAGVMFIFRFSHVSASISSAFITLIRCDYRVQAVPSAHVLPRFARPSSTVAGNWHRLNALFVHVYRWYPLPYVCSC